MCWNEQPKQRPTFKDLRATFDAMLLAEKNNSYIALSGIDENKLIYQSLHVDKVSASCTALNVKNNDDSITDKSLPTRKLTSSKVSAVSLDETCSAGRMKETRRPDRLSLQVFNHAQQRKSENQYVESPMSGVGASPALSPTLQESELRQTMIEMDNVKQNNPKIEISVCKHQI